MPWTVKDVDEHKKGLTDDQKKKWVATANSVLAECISKGGSDATCAPKAIRIANGVTGNESGFCIHTAMTEEAYVVTEKMHQGKKHLIVPVTMMVEGVHNGSHGPLLHTIEELGRFPEAWNGIPVVIDHPEIEGQNVSANDPDIIETRTVGRVYNTHIDGNRLKAEAWIDEEKLKEVSPMTYEMIAARELIEVSIGVFTEEEVVTGDWNGEVYSAIAKSHRPDHLAILPTSVGACSVADGCGLRANAENKSIQSPQIAGDAGIEHTNKLLRTKFTKEVKTMSNAVSCPRCLEKVNALIANEQSKFTEDDREWLLSQEETILDKLSPVVQEVEKIVEVEKVVEVNKLTPDDQTALEFGKRQLKERRENWMKGIQANTSKELWPDAVLNEMNEENLERIFNSVKKENPVDYSLNGNGAVTTNASQNVEALYPAGINVETKK